MKIKAIIFDADGVLVLGGKDRKRFSQIYAEKFGLPIETMMPFFQDEMQDCLVGKKDLKVELKKYIKSWKWHGSVEEFVDFWLKEEANINEELIALLPNLKAKGIKLALGTNNEKYRTDFLWNTVGLGKHLDHSYASHAVGLKKPNQPYFEHIIKDLNLPAKEILFVDDDHKNVDAAKESGMNAEFYSSFETFKKDLAKYL